MVCLAVGASIGEAILIYYTDSRYKVYKDKLQNCSCKQFHCIGTCDQVETNSMTKNRGGNKGSEK